MAQIKLIEMYKILFGLNFFIPCVDENFSLKFIPVTKALYNKNNNNNQEYGYQEFDCLFKVLGNEDIPMNHVNVCSKGLPFVKNIQIRVNSMKNFNQMEFKVYIEDEKGFAIKKNALVLVENKIRFPKNKEKILEYITIMLKKLNFVIKLIKSTTKDFSLYQNIQLLFVYDDIIFDSDDLLKYISSDQIKSILVQIPFTERGNFTIEIIYISQTMNIYNILKSLDEMNKMKKKIEDLKNKNNNLEKTIEDLKNKNKNLENKIEGLEAQIKDLNVEIKNLKEILEIKRNKE